MSGILINLILQALGGAIGGNAIGGVLKNMSLGPLGNTIAGAVGGVGGASVLGSIIPALSGGSGSPILERSRVNLLEAAQRALS